MKNIVILATILIIAVSVVIANIVTKQTTKLFDVCYNLSLAYIASFVFYFLNNLLPEKSKEISSYKIISSDVNDLCSYMAELIAKVLYLNNINQDMQELKLENLKSLNDFVAKERLVYCKISCFKNGEHSFTSETCFNEILEIKKYGDIVIKKVEKIISIPAFENCSCDFIQTISKIKNAKFLKEYTTALEDSIKTKIDFTFISLDKYTYDFCKLFLDLCKFTDNTYSYTFIDMSQEEIDNYNKKQKETFEKHPEIMQLLKINS